VDAIHHDDMTRPPPAQGTGMDWVLDGPQRRAVEWMLDRERVGGDISCYGGILAEDTGFGKTYAMCGLLKVSPMSPCLIVTPSAVLSQWPPVIFGITGIFPIVFTSMSSNFKRLVLNAESAILENIIVLTTHTIVTRHRQAFAQRVWGRIVVDEAHVLRNPKTETYKAFCSLKAQCRWAVTATPLQNRDDDFLSISKFVGLHATNIEVIRDTIMYRSSSSSIPQSDIEVSDLEDIEVAIIELTKSERECYEWVASQSGILKQIETSIDAISMHYTHMTRVLRLRQVATDTRLLPASYYTGCNLSSSKVTDEIIMGSKIKFVVSECELMVSEGSSGVVFCNWIDEMDMLEEAISKCIQPSQNDKSVHGSNRLEIWRLQGSSSHSERDNLMYMLGGNKVSNEALKGVTVILLCQINCGGCGLNLQYSLNHVIIMRPQWNPALEYQAIRRVVRRGQTKNVRVRRLVSRGTIDENIVELQRGKVKLISDVAMDDMVAKMLSLTTTETEGHDKPSLGEDHCYSD
jgi:SNF2 family DNA or RNA helicase